MSNICHSNLKCQLKKIYHIYFINIISVLERQLDECLESLEREREEKMSLRRELHELADRENLPRTPSRDGTGGGGGNASACPDSPRNGAFFKILFLSNFFVQIFRRNFVENFQDRN